MELRLSNGYRVRNRLDQYQKRKFLECIYTENGLPSTNHSYYDHLKDIKIIDLDISPKVEAKFAIQNYGSQVWRSPVLTPVDAEKLRDYLETLKKNGYPT